jgi:formate C-acetyltransferase
MPAIFNDERIVPAIGSDDYSIVGCAEWGVPHESFPAAGAGFINLPHVLLLALHDGTENGRRVGPATGRPADMEELREAYRIQLRHLLRRATDGNNAIETAHARHRPTPFLSTIVGGCVESGVELNAGGARRNQTGFQGVGLADVADSFSAIEEIVFRDGVATWEEMVAAVDRNFEGDGELRARILNRVSRYGESEANGYARFVSESFSEELSAFTNPRGGRYVAGFWTMTTHQGFGRRTRALPSGRLAGESLSNGISPVQGCERRGPTATLSSAAANVPVGNGCVLNLKMSPDHLRGEKGKVVLNGLVRGYFAKGGQQVQFNVLDPQVLIEAKKDPGKYRDLVVRISGYSAYFNDLTEALKDEIIARALHGS